VFALPGSLPYAVWAVLFALGYAMNIQGRKDLGWVNSALAEGMGVVIANFLGRR